MKIPNLNRILIFLVESGSELTWLVFLLLLVFVVLGDGNLSWKRLIQSERSIT